MQLISITLLLLSLLALLGAIAFVVLWHRASHRATVIEMLREEISHIGISAIVLYPDTPAPLFAILEESYPRSEAIIVTDLQHYLSPFGELIGRFHLVRVNHSHLDGVRALYRSRRRTFRRVVLIDRPSHLSEDAIAVAKEVASFDYTLTLQGESLISHDALTYCANIIASHPTTKSLSLTAMVGEECRLERASQRGAQADITLHSNRALAWRKASIALPLLAIAAPTLLIVAAHITEQPLLRLSAIMVCATIVALLYISSRVVVEKSLFATTCIIIKNFSRFLIDQIKKIYYLYKKSGVHHFIGAQSDEMRGKSSGKNRKQL